MEGALPFINFCLSAGKSHKPFSIKDLPGESKCQISWALYNPANHGEEATDFYNMSLGS